MNIPRLMSSAKKVVSDNSPVILTAIGVTGTITTAVLTAKATVKAIERLNATEAERTETYLRDHELLPPFGKKEKFKLLWTLYVPAVTTGAVTCTCIIGANYIGTRRAAALAAAYSLTEKALSEYKDLSDYKGEILNEYKDKVIQKAGEETHKEIVQEMAQERLAQAPPAAIMGIGESLCHDAFTNRYFASNKETIRRAANDINYQILHNDWATLSDFYKKVGLEPTSVSDELGWNGENPCEILFAPIEGPNGLPALSYDFAFVPIRAPWVV